MATASPPPRLPAPGYAPPDFREHKPVFDLLFLIVVFWPVAIIWQLVTAGVMMAVAACAIFLTLKIARVRLGLFALFTFVICAQLAISFAQSRNAGAIWTQSNHLVQIMLLYPGFVMLVQQARWQALLRDKRVMMGLAGLIVVSILYETFLNPREDAAGHWLAFHNISINMLALTAAFFLQDRYERRRMVVPFVVFIAFSMLAAYRSTVDIFFIVAALFYFVRLPPAVTKAICAVLIFGPIVIYLTADRDTLIAMLDFDHNTYVRAEFMRGALPTLLQNPVFGVGFDVPFRDNQYAYLTDHPLLRLDESVSVVSNHHSIFDTALRLGALGAGLLYYMVFIRPKLGPGYGYRGILMVAMALGLGSNAWFENQNQIAQVALLMALLNYGSRFEGPSAAPARDPYARNFGWYHRRKRLR